MTNTPLKYLVVLGVTALAVRTFRGTAQRVGLVDRPGGRKRHEGAVPVIGGPAMFVGFGCGALTLLDSLYVYRPLFAAMTLVLIAGVLDDLRDLSASRKLLLQILSALLMTSWGGMTVDDLGNIFGFGPLYLRTWNVPFTVICVLGVINAINMADGADGLAGGLAFVAIAFLAASALLLERSVPAKLLLVMLVAVAGFLLYNMRLPWQRRAAIFMGDSGTMLLGYFLTWFSIELTQRGGERVPPIVAVWFLAVPLLDMYLVVVRRLLKGANPFRAARDHLHHILLVAGWSTQRTVNFMLAIAVLLAALGLVGWRAGISEAYLTYAFIALLAGYYVLARRAWRLVRLLRKGGGSRRRTAGVLRE